MHTVAWNDWLAFATKSKISSWDGYRTRIEDAKEMLRKWGLIIHIMRLELRESIRFLAGTKNIGRCFDCGSASTGLMKGLIETIVRYAPKKMAYVSCNALPGQGT